MRNMEVPVRAGKKVGLYVDAGVVYTVSPVHTDQYYARKIKELMDSAPTRSSSKTRAGC